MGNHGGDKKEKGTDPRPYVFESGLKSRGAANAAAVTAGMVLMALVVGFIIGFLVFLVMNLSAWVSNLLWGGYLGGRFEFLLFPLALCTIGGLAIGLWTHFSGNRIAALPEVLGEFKKTGSYRIHPIKGTVSFLLPLIFGGSVGFEAGLTGIITAGCCWIRDKLKAAGLRAAAVGDVTVAASLSAILGTPLAGIVAGAESSHDDGGELLEPPDVNAYNMRRPAKIVLYTAAAFGAFAGIWLFSRIFGATSGFPHFGAVELDGVRVLWVFGALAAGYAMTWLYHGSAFLFSCLGKRLGNGRAGTIVKPVIAGVVMGVCAVMFPYVLFPGEEQCHMLMESWGTWTALALIATGLIKAVVTPMCINMGWVGGNFCPSIFAGAACGYGLAVLTGADPALMVTVTTTAFLAGVVRKPLLTAAILLLCFPLDSILWCGLAAVIGSVLPVPSKLIVSE